MKKLTHVQRRCMEARPRAGPLCIEMSADPILICQERPPIFNAGYMKV